MDNHSSISLLLSKSDEFDDRANAFIEGVEEFKHEVEALQTLVEKIPVTKPIAGSGESTPEYRRGAATEITAVLTGGRSTRHEFDRRAVKI